MPESGEALKQEFLADPDYRYAYAEDFLNASIATQIVTIREQRGLNQGELGKLIGTKQPGVSRLENVNHSTWKTETLKKIARALGVRLKISFETFGTLLGEDDGFCREALMRPAFHDDPVFKEHPEKEHLEKLEHATITENVPGPLSAGISSIFPADTTLSAMLRDHVSVDVKRFLEIQESGSTRGLISGLIAQEAEETVIHGNANPAGSLRFQEQAVGVSNNTMGQRMESTVDVRVRVIHKHEAKVEPRTKKRGLRIDLRKRRGANGR